MSNELSAITREILDLKKEVGVNLWKIGERLNIIKEKQLYLSDYPFFEEYVDKELDINKKNALFLMKKAKEFTHVFKDWSRQVTLQESISYEPSLSKVIPIDSEPDGLPIRVADGNNENDFIWNAYHEGLSIIVAMRGLKDRIRAFHDSVDACKLRKSWKSHGLREKILSNQQIINALKKDL